MCLVCILHKGGDLNSENDRRTQYHPTLLYTELQSRSSMSFLEELVSQPPQPRWQLVSAFGSFRELGGSEGLGDARSIAKHLPI